MNIRDWLETAAGAVESAGESAWVLLSDLVPLDVNAYVGLGVAVAAIALGAAAFILVRRVRRVRAARLTPVDARVVRVARLAALGAHPGEVARAVGMSRDAIAILAPDVEWSRTKLPVAARTAASSRLGAMPNRDLLSNVSA